MLSFTAEEAWRIVHPGGRDDLHPHAGAMRCRRSPTPPRSSRSGRASSPCARWCRRNSRRCASTGKIGSSLQAEVTISAPDDDYAALASLGDDLRFVMITSAATRRRAENGGALRSRSTRAPARSASAAGTSAPTSAPTPRIRRSAVAACANLYGDGERRAVRLTRRRRCANRRRAGALACARRVA